MARNDSPQVGAVLLAAGQSRRFGCNKLLCPVEGVPMIERAFGAFPPDLFAAACVVSSWPEILALGERRGYRAIPNPQFREGQAASIRLGLAPLVHLDGVVFGVCDQPWLRRESVRRLLDGFAQTPDRICALSWQGQRGNPVLFPAACFPELLALKGDQGGSAVLRAHPRRLRLVPVDHPWELADVDTPQQRKICPPYCQSKEKSV